MPATIIQLFGPHPEACKALRYDAPVWGYGGSIASASGCNFYYLGLSHVSCAVWETQSYADVEGHSPAGLWMRLMGTRWTGATYEHAPLCPSVYIPPTAQPTSHNVHFEDALNALFAQPGGDTIQISYQLWGRGYVCNSRLYIRE